MRSARRTLLLTILSAFSLQVSASPFTPKDDADVLERLTYQSIADPSVAKLRRMRAELAATPDNLELAVRLAWRYIEIGRAQADPRNEAYAQAALRPWWHLDPPPAAVLLVRATLRQSRHDFHGALADLSGVLRMQSHNAQAWLTRAVVLSVLGEPRDALGNCMPLFRLASPLLATTCAGNAMGLGGQAEAVYEWLLRSLERSHGASARERLWALTVLADIATRLGRHAEAESHYREALRLELRDIYLLSAYADFLLDQGRAEEVYALLRDDSRPDPLLLRLALAEKQLSTPELKHRVTPLQARFAASRLRGSERHLGSEARLELHLLNRPQRALKLALDNWAVQREPVDARLVLESALAADKAAAADPVLAWLIKTGLEDVRLAALRERLTQAR
ncbi:MAG: tetratricopeptide repeat protein [Gammaproteobacteria bacterium]|nr:tetratricopeptide repeat protein [Gammaproteobacteria bacterium]